MATIGLSGGIGATLGTWFHTFRSDFAEQRQRRRIYSQTYRELAEMSDRDLQDIGISRLRIEEVAREAAYGRHIA